MRPILAAVSLLALAACSRAPEPGDAAPGDAPAAAVVEVAAVDEVGPLPGAATGLALWSHPGIPFNGMILAASAGGIVAYNVEDGAEVARDDAVEAEGIGVFYEGRAAAAQGHAVTRTRDGFRFYAIENDTRALRLMTTMFVARGSDDRGYCVGRDASGEGHALTRMTGTGFTAHPLSIEAGVVTAGAAASGEVVGGLMACVVDDIDGAVIAVAADGALYRIEDGAATRLASTGVAEPAAVALALNGLVEGGPTEECCGQIAVLDAANGVVALFDREDGRTLGAVRLKSSYDIEGVGAATALLFGYGNFGAVYRDGILGLATNGEAPAIRLSPLNGVMDALAAPLGPTANPRDLAPQAAEDPFAIDIEIVNP